MSSLPNIFWFSPNKVLSRPEQHLEFISKLSKPKLTPFCCSTIKNISPDVICYQEQISNDLIICLYHKPTKKLAQFIDNKLFCAYDSFSLRLYEGALPFTTEDYIKAGVFPFESEQMSFYYPELPDGDGEEEERQLFEEEESDSSADESPPPAFDTPHHKLTIPPNTYSSPQAISQTLQNSLQYTQSDLHLTSPLLLKNTCMSIQSPKCYKSKVTELQNRIMETQVQNAQLVSYNNKLLETNHMLSEYYHKSISKNDQLNIQLKTLNHYIAKLEKQLTNLNKTNEELREQIKQIETPESIVSYDDVLHYFDTHEPEYCSKLGS